MAGTLQVIRMIPFSSKTNDAHKIIIERDAQQIAVGPRGLQSCNLRWSGSQLCNNDPGFSDPGFSRLPASPLRCNEQVVEEEEFETENPTLQGKMTSTFTLTVAGGGAVHDNVPPGVSPPDNETGWSMALDKLATLLEAGTIGFQGGQDG